MIFCFGGSLKTHTKFVCLESVSVGHIDTLDTHHPVGAVCVYSGYIMHIRNTRVCGSYVGSVSMSVWVYPGHIIHHYNGISRCPIARHRTVNARPRTLLIYEGSESHVIKNMATTVKFFSPHKVGFVVFRTATVRCRAARHRTSVPCDHLFSSISFIVRCRAIGQRGNTICCCPLSGLF